MNLQELKAFASSGDPRAVINYLLAAIESVELVRGSTGTPGPPGKDAPPVSAGEGLASWEETQDGAQVTRVSLTGPRHAISSISELPARPTDADLIQHVIQLTQVVKELKAALSARQITY